MPPPPKRRLTSTQTSSQSSTTSPAKPRPAKRVRREEPNPHHQPTSVNSPPSRVSRDVSPKVIEEGSNSSALFPLPVPTKRVLHPGSLRRLSTGHPSKSLNSNQREVPSEEGGATGLARSTATLSGNRIGGKSKDLKDGLKVEEIWVHSKGAKLGSTKETQGQGGGRGGVGYSAWLKRGVSAFVERGCTCLKIHGMGATIPTALSLALAIRDAVPGGSPVLPSRSDAETQSDHSNVGNDSGRVDDDDDDDQDDGGLYEPEREDVQMNISTKDKVRAKPASRREDGGQEGIFETQVRTGTTIVGDEITPEDDDEDIVYQSRSKSTVEITLKLDEELGKLVGVGKKFQHDRGNSSTRGGKRRAAGGGRGRGRAGRDRG